MSSIISSKPERTNRAFVIGESEGEEEEVNYRSNVQEEDIELISIEQRLQRKDLGGEKSRFATRGKLVASNLQIARWNERRGEEK